MPPGFGDKTLYAYLLLATECKIVENHRTYGSAPYTVAVVDGGPGAAGEMAPVARELAGDRGILEPLQTATSLEGQVEELHVTLGAFPFSRSIGEKRRIPKRSDQGADNKTRITDDAPESIL